MPRVHRSERATRPRLSDRHAVGEHEFRLDAILAALWQGALSREAAAGRLMAELGMDCRDALAEIDAFLAE
jgi:hypothetical protein